MKAIPEDAEIYEKAQTEVESLNTKLKNIENDLHEGMLKGAFYSGGFSSETPNTLRSASLERKVVELAR